MQVEERPHPRGVLKRFKLAGVVAVALLGGLTMAVPLAATQVASASTTNTETSSSWLSICKVAGDSAQQGRQFTFSAQAGGSTAGPVTVEAAPVGDTYGSCANLGLYQAGTNVNITENATSGVHVSDIQADGGTLSNANYGAGTVTVTVGDGESTYVSYTNSTTVSNANGYLEICKNAGDAYVPQGPWSFTVTNSSGEVVDTEQVLTGQCNENPAGLPAGNYTVTESVSSPYYVSEISAIPSSDLVSSNVENATGTFTVQSGESTTAFFTNDTLTGYVKVCKTLAPNADALSGQTFNFNVSDAAGTQVVSVIAQEGQTPCSIDFTALPAGSTATITEQAVPNVAVSNVSVIPPSAGTVTGTTATVTVSATNINAADFTNEALGFVEVCKLASDSSVTGSFNFSVNGGPSFPVAVGGCSSAIQVPAGTATVREAPRANYFVSSITAIGFSPTEQNRLISDNLAAGTSVVSVPYGGVGDETVVSYTNNTLSGLFKICTAETSPDANLNGATFPYAWSYTVNGKKHSGTVNLKVNVNQPTCSGLKGPIPVINANGTPVQVSVTANAPAGLTGVDLAAFNYSGNGSVASAPMTPGNFPQTAVIDLGTGINIDTFTNGATH